MHEQKKLDMIEFLKCMGYKEIADLNIPESTENHYEIFNFDLGLENDVSLYYGDYLGNSKYPNLN